MNNKLEAFARLLEVMNRLRVDCPWDRKQTFESLRNNTIEETFELVDALDQKDMAHIKEELGDLLLHIVFYAKMGEEQNSFDIADVANAISDKLIFRHPHVFGDEDASDAEEVKKLWEQRKLKEKEQRHERKSVLSGVPRSLPAMVKAFRIGQKAAAAGYDWEAREDVWLKVEEEYKELRQGISADNKENINEEFGDLLFALINAARLYDIDPEAALQQCNAKFIRRFSHIENSAEAQGRELKELTLDQMEALWQEAKQNENK